MKHATVRDTILIEREQRHCLPIERRVLSKTGKPVTQPVKRERREGESKVRGHYYCLILNHITITQLIITDIIPPTCCTPAAGITTDKLITYKFKWSTFFLRLTSEQR